MFIAFIVICGIVSSWDLCDGKNVVVSAQQQNITEETLQISDLSLVWDAYIQYMKCNKQFSCTNCKYYFSSDESAGDSIQGGDSF